MGIGSFVKKAVGGTVGATLGMNKKLLGAGMKALGVGGSGGGGREATEKKPRYKRRVRNQYEAGSGYVPAAERYKRSQEKQTAAKVVTAPEKKPTMLGSGLLSKMARKVQK